MEISNLEQYKKWGLLLSLVCMVMAVSIATFAVVIVLDHGVEAQGTVRTIISFACGVVIFAVLAIISFNLFRNPSYKTVFILFRFLTAFFIAIVVLACFGIFLPTY
jgi:hypothetical protein